MVRVWTGERHVVSMQAWLLIFLLLVCDEPVPTEPPNYSRFSSTPPMHHRSLNDIAVLLSSPSTITANTLQV